MTALVEISKRGPRLTPEQRAQQKRERTQARVGLASNALGLTAGAAATGAALRDERFEHGGRVAQRLFKIGEKIPKPIQNLNARLGTKGKAALAGGALALQAGNMGGDVVANRVLARSAATPQKPGQVKKGLGKLIGTGKVNFMPIGNEAARELAGTTTGRGLHIANEGGWAVKPGVRTRLKGVGEIDEGVHMPLKMKSRVGGGLTKRGKAVYIGAPTVAGAAGVAEHKRRQGVKKSDGEWMLDSYISKADHTSGHGSIDKSFPPQPLMMPSHASMKKKLGKIKPDEFKQHGTFKLSEVKKAYRRYDPEADRQRRLGLAAGAGVGGGLLLGSQAAKRFTTDVSHKGDKVKGIAVRPGHGKGAILLTGGALGSAALGGLAYRKGLSERNNPWN